MTVEPALGVEEIWAEVGTSLQRFVRRRVSDPHEAEDVVAEVLLRIHEHLPDLDDRERVTAWVFRIARNAIADHYRRAATRREQPSGVELDGHVPAAAEAPSGELRSELATCLRPLIERLASPYREAITLTELEGVSQTAAAARLGLSVSGMKSRVQRARAQVGDLLVGCCEIELDRRGGVTSYQPRRDPCDCRTTPEPHR